MRYIKYFEMYDDFTQNAKLSDFNLKENDVFSNRLHNELLTSIPYLKYSHYVILPNKIKYVFSNKNNSFIEKEIFSKPIEIDNRTEYEVKSFESDVYSEDDSDFWTLSEIKAYFKDIKHYILDKFVDNVINKNYN